MSPLPTPGDDDTPEALVRCAAIELVVANPADQGVGSGSAREGVMSAAAIEAFGGGIAHGHQPSGFFEKTGHPDNIWWYQSKLANAVYALLDEKQRARARVKDQVPCGVTDPAVMADLDRQLAATPQHGDDLLAADEDDLLTRRHSHPSPAASHSTIRSRLSGVGQELPDAADNQAARTASVASKANRESFSRSVETACIAARRW